MRFAAVPLVLLLAACSVNMTPRANTREDVRQVTGADGKLYVIGSGGYELH